MPSPDLFLRVPSDRGDPGVARHEVTTFLGSIDHEPSAADLALVVSELVSNAVLHGAPPIELTLSCSPHLIRVEVFDGSPNGEHVAVHPVSDGRARGLHIVAELAARWGITRQAGGKVVWFEYDPSRT